jgi:hypothetical protein
MRALGGIMKSKFVLIVLLVVLAEASADTLSLEAPVRPRLQVYALEGLGALGGMTGCALGGAGGYLAVGCVVGVTWFLAVLSGSDGYGSGFDEGWYKANGVVVGLCAAVAPAIAGSGAAGVGQRLGEHGSRGWAIGGAYAGGPLALGAIVLGRKIAYGRDGWRDSNLDYPFYVLGGLCIPAGAVLGYNLGVPREAAGPQRPGIGSRLDLPAVALTSVELPDHSLEYGVKVQLAGLRF